jgi:transposase
VAISPLNELLLNYRSVTESEAREFFLSHRWQNQGRACLHCGSRAVREIRRNRLWCADCHYEFGDFTGTYISLLRVGLKDWLGLLQLFALEWSARQTAEELGLSYPTVLKGFHLIRLAIAGQGQGLPPRKGPARAGREAPGRRDSELLGPILGIQESPGGVKVEPVAGLGVEEIAGLKPRQLGRSNILYTGRFRAYDNLMFCLAGPRGRAPAPVAFPCKRRVMALPGFRGFARERLLKFHGISAEKFPLYLKEMEFRYNHRKFPALLACLAAWLTHPLAESL